MKVFMDEVRQQMLLPTIRYLLKFGLMVPYSKDQRSTFIEMGKNLKISRMVKESKFYQRKNNERNEASKNYLMNLGCLCLQHFYTNLA
jgi:hypothetical protein